MSNRNTINIITVYTSTKRVECINTRHIDILEVVHTLMSRVENVVKLQPATKVDRHTVHDQCCDVVG